MHKLNELQVDGDDVIPRYVRIWDRRQTTDKKVGEGLKTKPTRRKRRQRCKAHHSDPCQMNETERQAERNQVLHLLLYDASANAGIDTKDETENARYTDYCYTAGTFRQNVNAKVKTIYELYIQSLGRRVAH